MSLTIQHSQVIRGGIKLRGNQPVTIVTAGLVEYLDARAYSGSGTTWTASVGNNATLYNGVTWHNTGPGYFNFSPGSLQYAEAADIGNLSSWTAECWFRTTADLTPYSLPALITTTYDGYGQINYTLSPYPNQYTNSFSAGYYNGAWHNTSNYTVTQGTWYQMAGTFDGTTMKLYVNGALTSSVSGGGSSQANGGPIRIARRWDGDGQAVYFMPADIATVRVYNTALTGTEVLQNFTGERERFGI